MLLFRREMGTPQINAFPYLTDGSAAPYTDGILVGTSSGIDTNVYLPTPGELTQPLVPAGRRNAQQEYIGNTSCVAADGIAHNVLAGNS